ncbi:MAG: nucleoside-diphosphate sugar epimerase [Candidatus Omnitrophica bacterium CG11_big_fil_rev_8_21_14_0_20_42_13]|uniref:UDP-glucuronate decarboxylase n=1 Tax=Candidatus Ghiorseimicrobium undicola TaxID=1974746 RepID=A0A2H0LYX5_9BACT|nr:MAG: nucleoside-diphosphate sugar epimerase [Candidatus Omnitrophica bacterium CG11_big_fil_rev_8_21_14_0_20_42_13]
MKKILITGVAGMIGSHLLDELIKRGYEVIGTDDLSFGKLEKIQHNLDNKNFKFYDCDILDHDKMNVIAKGVDVIAHLAAVKKLGKEEFDVRIMEVNGRGTESMFALAKSNKARIIFASTSDVYGMSSDIPLREDGDILMGTSSIKRWSYAVSKLYSEHIAFAYYRHYGVPMVVLRYFGGFSPRSSASWSGGHIPIFIDAVLNDKEIIIHGDGKQTRSMAYISDIVNGTVLAMTNDKATGQIINIGNDEELSVIDTAYLIHEIANTGKKLKLKLVPFKELFGNYRDIMRRIPDLTKARNILGYRPSVSLRQGIELTIKAMRKTL